MIWCYYDESDSMTWFEHSECTLLGSLSGILILIWATGEKGQTMMRVTFSIIFSLSVSLLKTSETSGASRAERVQQIGKTLNKKIAKNDKINDKKERKKAPGALKVLPIFFLQWCSSVETRYPELNSDQVLLLTMIILQRMQEFTGYSGGPRETNEDVFSRMIWNYFYADTYWYTFASHSTFVYIKNKF